MSQKNLKLHSLRPLKILLTCGPARAPIDAVRSITNASTGELGALLASSWAAQGHEVICWRGVGATMPFPLELACFPFETNHELAKGLEQEQRRSGPVDIVFHSAALCDFEVAQILQEKGRILLSAKPDCSDAVPPLAQQQHGLPMKLPSSEGSLQLLLKPAQKILPQLRSWFPHSILVAWKFEVNGTRQEAFTAAYRQLETQNTDFCILNGPAYGTGLAAITQDHRLMHFENKLALAKGLLEWICKVA